MSRLRAIGIVDVGNQFLINKFVFGKNILEHYNSNETYNKGDFSIILDINTSKYTIAECLENGVTGPFDKSKWSEANMQTTLKKISDSTDIVVLSDTIPAKESVKLWFKPIDVSSGTITL